MTKKTQSGSAHLIIIIALAVVLIGTLGFVFWQNFMQPKTVSVQNNKTDTTIKTDTTLTTQPPVVDKNTLELTTWGIKGIYNGTHTIGYSMSDASHLRFTSSDLAGVCSDYSVGGIARYTGDELMSDVSPVSGDAGNKKVSEFYAADGFTQFSGNKHIGKYYYVWVSPQQGCYQSGSDTPDATATKISDDAHEFFKTLTAI